MTQMRSILLRMNCKLFQTCTDNVLFQCNAGLESQRIAGRLEHLGVEANPVLVTAPKPVSMLLAQHIFVCPSICNLLFPFYCCQWTPQFTQAFKDFMENMFCTCHLDVYGTATTESGLGCPKTADLCPML